MARAPTDNSDRRDSAALDKLMRVLWYGVLIGAFALIAAQYTGLIAAVGIGILIFLAAFAAGCFLGFLFGLPRVPQDSAPPPAPANASTSLSSTPSGPNAPAAAAPQGQVTRAKLLQSNTNLERISDWLTTMLVGATLVEIHNINDALVMFRDFLQSSATVFHEGGKASAGVLPAVGPIMLVFGAVCGFVYMYLNTRLVLVKLFAIGRSTDTWPTARERSFLRGLRTVSWACASPPSLSLKNAVCFLPGLPSPIVHATMLPSLGIVITPRVGPILAW